MDIMIREYRRADLPFMTEIWNQIVGEGNAFPQEELLGEGEAEAFFAVDVFLVVAFFAAFAVLFVEFFFVFVDFAAI